MLAGISIANIFNETKKPSVVRTSGRWFSSLKISYLEYYVLTYLLHPFFRISLLYLLSLLYLTFPIKIMNNRYVCVTKQQQKSYNIYIAIANIISKEYLVGKRVAINGKTYYARILVCKKSRCVKMNYNVDVIELPIGRNLYRHIDKPPEECKLQMRPNKGKNGRCNLHQDIYYCAKSLDALEIERGDNLKGSLVFSVVEQPILVGRVINEDVHDLLRGRIAEEQPTLVHTEILQKVGKDIVTTYDVTNFITDCVLKITPDGLMYSSVNSIDIIVGTTMFQLTDDTGWGNIALTQSGYKKIKEYRVVDISKYLEGRKRCR